MLKPMFSAIAMIACGAALAAPTKPERIAPVKLGGGFDLTCKLA